jgi:hypothetical protein
MPSLFVACVLFAFAPLTLAAQYSSAVNHVRAGGMAFFPMAQSGQMTSNLGAKTSFSGHEGVYALLVPQIPMSKLPAYQAYLVEVWMDDQKRAEVEVNLPPLGPQHSGIAFPVYMQQKNHPLPRLGKVFDLLLDASQTGSLAHRFLLKVYLAQDRIYLGEGGFDTASSFVAGRFQEGDAAVPLPGPVPITADAETEEFVRQTLGHDFSHLSLRTLVLPAPWQVCPPESKVLACKIRYQVQDQAGNCYQGESQLTRRLKKTGESGPVIGMLWPSVQVKCD